MCAYGYVERVEFTRTRDLLKITIHNSYQMQHSI